MSMTLRARIKPLWHFCIATAVLASCLASPLTGKLAADDHGGRKNTPRQAYFGDLHIHTKNSFDAFIFNVRVTPDDAYRFAKGEAIPHPLGFPLRLTGAPLDFIAVTDHAEYMGVLPAIADPDNPLSQLPDWQGLISTDQAEIFEAFQNVGTSLRSGRWIKDLRHLPTMRSAWRETIDAAERHYEPGVFTTFIGYEYTSPPGSQNLHRNVIFAGSDVPYLPFSSIDSQNPEDLWSWLDGMRARGMEGMAIPHNSNVSNGLMFQRTTFDGRPQDDAYAALRMRNEPLVEVTQVKGTSEVHPSLSPNDEWADFGLYETLIATTIPTKIKGGYVREAYGTGLTFQAAQGFNPYKFGLIGSSDTHNGGASLDEDRFSSKVGVMDGTAVRRGSVPPGGRKTWEGIELNALNAARYSTWGASGLAAVWAEENTRESIYSAFRRKETFATTGPRIRVRFFAGYDFADNLAKQPDMVDQAYAGGVPMGADLAAKNGAAPKFLVWAMRDPNASWLQRAQVIKVWVENGAQKDKVFDVACSDGLTVDPKTHRCPDNGATVNLETCETPIDKGDVELRALWQDPEFNAGQHAAYYVRILENPTCRWSTWDAIKAGSEPNPKLAKTIQERAWSSPIWYLPEAE